MDAVGRALCPMLVIQATGAAAVLLREACRPGSIPAPGTITIIAGIAHTLNG